MKKHALAAALLLTGVMAMPAGAASLYGGESLNLSVPVGDDVYAGGGTVSISDSVGGDALVGGGQLLITGAVSQDVAAAGGSLTLQGSVGDDLRAAGGNLIVTGSVGDDLILMGGSLTIGGSVTVGGDALLAGGAIVMDGTVNGKAQISGGDVTINGTLNGPASITADRITINGTVNAPVQLVAYDIVLGENARFAMDVLYWRAGGEMDFGDKVAGTATFDQSLQLDGRAQAENAKVWFKKLVAAWFFFTLFSAALIIALFTAFFRNSLHRMASIVHRSFWKSVGIGMIYFIVAPVAAVILFMTVIGWPLAILVLCAFGMSLLFAKVFAACVIAQWLAIRSKKHWKPFMIFVVALLAYVVLKALMFIPVLGWIVDLIVIAAAFGSGIVFKGEVYRSLEPREK